MDPGVGLQAASGLVSFLLKTAVEWLVCLLLVRIAGSARSRFNLWLAMLLAFAAQWIWMWAGVVRAAFAARIPVGGMVAGISSSAGRRIAITAPVAGRVSQVVAALLVVYGAIVAWRMFGALAARARLAKAMRHRCSPADRVAMTFQEVAQQASLGSRLGCGLRVCEVWVLPGLSSPATLGWLRPRVIVPPACQTQDEAELKAVFWHELKHVQRRDALWNALVRACRGLLWFHPAVHHAIASLNAQRELACDAAVVREHPHSRDVYASCLLHFARLRELEPAPAIPAIEMASSASLLATRVRSILSDGGENYGASRGARMGRAAANLLLVGLMAATVPGLNILFSAEQHNPLGQLSIAGISSVAARGTALAARAKAGDTRAENLAAPSSAGDAEAVAQSTSDAPQQDEGLAAEHRAAMGILTESTEMDAQTAASDGRSPAGLNPSASGSAKTSSNSNRASWSTIAVDAAARMGPLMNGHDADDRH